MPYKPGYKTTEFLLTAAVIVGQLIAALTSNLAPRWAALGSTIAAGLYAIARGQSKQPVVPVVPQQAPPTK